jgi:arylsulfatase A-like enzyme
MKKFNIVVGICVSLLVSSVSAQKPNIIWIFSDDHAFQAISAYKSRFANLAPTPNIDRLAKNGMRFDRSHVANSICAPARACVLTGQHSHKNGVLDNRGIMDYDKNVTFPQILQQNGYTTAIYGKWHLKSAPQGFDDWAILPGQGSYHNPDYRVKEGDGEVKVRKAGWVDDLTTDMALEFLKNKRSKDKPFMMMCQFKTPHRRWQPPIRHIDTYENVVFPEPETLFDDYKGRKAAEIATMRISRDASMDLDMHMDLNATLGRLDGQALAEATAKYEAINKPYYELNLKEGSKEWVKWKYQRYIKEFMRCVTAIDENVGRILDYLEATGLDKNTLVCYSADQGFYMGEHGWFDKRFIYEESFRTPLLMQWPGQIAPGSVNQDLVQNIDIAPTFLKMAGLEVPTDMQGESLVEVMKGQTPSNWRDSLYYHYYEYSGAHTVPNHEAVATKRYKLVHYYDINHHELIDLKKDPLEVENQYNNPEYASVIKHLQAKLHARKTEYQVPELPEINTAWRMTPDKLEEVQKARAEAKRKRLQKQKEKQVKAKKK